MTFTTTLLGLIAVTAAAATVQGVAGFGFGLLAATGYMWLVGPAEAIPLVMLVNFAMSGFLAVKARGEIDRELAPGLIAGCLLGLPCGVIVASAVDVGTLLITIGVLLIAFAAFLLAQDRRRAVAASDPVTSRWAGPVGFLGGGLGTAVGMPGPPVIALLTLRRAGRDTLRSTSLGFFGLAYLAGLLVHAVMVGVEPGVWINGGALIPVAFLTGLGGAGIAKHVDEHAFRVGVLVLLAVVGFASLVRGLATG